MIIKIIYTSVFFEVSCKSELGTSTIIESLCKGALRLVDVNIMSPRVLNFGVDQSASFRECPKVTLRIINVGTIPYKKDDN